MSTLALPTLVSNERFPNTGSKKQEYRSTPRREKLMRASGFLLVPYESELSTAYSQMRTPYIRRANIRAILQHEVKKTGVPKYSKTGEADAGIRIFCHAVGQQATAALWQKCELRIFAGRTYERFPNTGSKKQEY